MKTYLITGCYGFLGYSLAIRLLEQGHRVIGLDRLVAAKSEKSPRVSMLAREKKFEFHETDIANWDQVRSIFKLARPDEVMHFAAQYSVPASTQAAQSYAKSNCHGFINMIGAAHDIGMKRFNYASSTFVEEHFRPTSMYGATKQFNEDWAGVYSHVWGMATVGIRYGSTFGPWSRSDIGIYTQTRRILRGEAMKVTDPFRYATAFLYRDDAVEGTLRIMNTPLEGKHSLTLVANDRRHDLGQVVRLLEKYLGKQANCAWDNYIQTNDTVPEKQLNDLFAKIKWVPQVTVEEGVRRFAEWALKRHAEGKL